jgi:Electron transfer DM13
MKTKNLLSFFIAAVCICIACSKQNGTSDVPGTGTVDTTSAVLQYSGVFMNGPYGSVSGKAAVYAENGVYILKLADVAISNGPDLHVYLSKEVLPVNFIDLDRLQSTSGNQLYTIPCNPGFTQYKYALIHCQRYNHLFGSAELQ